MEMADENIINRPEITSNRQFTPHTLLGLRRKKGGRGKPSCHALERRQLYLLGSGADRYKYFIILVYVQYKIENVTCVLYSTRILAEKHRSV